MGTQNQHYVPRVYLKAWQCQVETLREPDKKFQGVYVFDKSYSVGNGTNIRSILWERHLYTVRFEYMYISKSCPKIYLDFSEKIKTVLRTREKPIYAKCDYNIIKSRNSIKKHLYSIDDWEYYYDTGENASKARIENQLKDITSYVLEDGLDKYYESNWEDVLNNFINSVHNSKDFGSDCYERIIPEKVALDMLRFFFMMLCRSPHFTAMGIYEEIKKVLLSIIREDNTSNIIPKNEMAVEQMLRSVWYSELYKIIYKQSGGFFHNIIKKTLSDCQMILYETNPNSIHFITNDNPAFENRLCVTVENRNGFYFPLTPQYLLFIGRGEGNINLINLKYADNELVKILNRIISSNKKSKIIADTRNLAYSL